MSQRNEHLDRKKKQFSKFSSFEIRTTHALLGAPVALRNLTPNMYMSAAEKYAGELRKCLVCFLQFFSFRTREAMRLSKALTSHTA